MSKTEEMMLNFLNRHYPVNRTKIDKRFKRTIILDNGGVYSLSDDISKKEISNKLIIVLKKVFACDESICIKIVQIFI